MPPLPPLTRCNQDSRFARLWKKAKPIKSVGNNSPNFRNSSYDGDCPRPSTSRGTQRLYIRLNTLYYLNSHIHSLDKSISFFTSNNHGGPSSFLRAPNTNRHLAPSHHFDFIRSTIQSAVLHVSEVAAYRLIFLDSNHTFYNGLYIGDNESSRIRPALRILKQNLTLLVTVLTDRAQPGAVKEVMKAAFEAFLMVLLAGGSERAFVRSDYDMVLEDFRSLTRLFCASGEGLVAEDVVDEEAEVVEGILTLMGMPEERLIEEFSIAACESSGMGGGMDTPGRQRVLPMPPTTGRWSRADPNTVLRVLCHRNDDAANQFLKKTFQLPKRR